MAGFNICNHLTLIPLGYPHNFTIMRWGLYYQYYWCFISYGAKI